MKDKNNKQKPSDGQVNSTDEVRKNDKTWTCKKCKTDNSSNSVFCKDCGDYK